LTPGDEIKKPASGSRQYFGFNQVRDFTVSKIARGPFLTSPLGENFDPRGEVVPKGQFNPLGVKLSPVCPSILLNSRECSPLGVNEGLNIPPRGQISPLGVRGEVKNGPQLSLISCIPKFLVSTGPA
jgi:hypothetical protein